MNYLQLCQDTVRESGTISGDATPATVTGQSGRLLKVVNWVAKAWQEIQNLHDDWLWMRAEFTGAVVAGSAKYTSASWAITRWSRWISTTPDDPAVMSIYLTSAGVADERQLREIEWPIWRQRYGFGLQVNRRPSEYAISPQGEFCLGPIPDAAYTVRGEYQMSAQTLAANADIPELPDTTLHTVIVWKALLLLAQFDEGQWPTGVAQLRCQDDLQSMKKYRPKIRFGQVSIA
jgi:hypothetical protein